MRKDMKKVLTERPRVGHRRCYREIRARQNRGDYDNMPSHQGMRRPYGWETKEFSDLIGPLVRYLWSCRGRRWDDVWSEICVQLSDNTIDSHLKDHVRMEVETQVTIRDGKVLGKPGGRWWYRGGNYEVRGLYVDPETGLLCSASDDRTRWLIARLRPDVVVDDIPYSRDENGVLRPFEYRYWRAQRAQRTNYLRKIIGPDQEAVCIEGIWYWVVFEDVPAPTWDRTPGLQPRLVEHTGYDFVLGEPVKQGRYRAKKRQMSAADLRRCGLVNEPH